MPKFEVVSEAVGNRREPPTVKVWLEQMNNGEFRLMYKKDGIVHSFMYADLSNKRLVVYSRDCKTLELTPTVV